MNNILEELKEYRDKRYVEHAWLGITIQLTGITNWGEVYLKACQTYIDYEEHILAICSNADAKIEAEHGLTRYLEEAIENYYEKYSVEIVTCLQAEFLPAIKNVKPNPYTIIFIIDGTSRLASYIDILTNPEYKKPTTLQLLSIRDYLTNLNRCDNFFFENINIEQLINDYWAKYWHDIISPLSKEEDLKKAAELAAKHGYVLAKVWEPEA